MLFTRSPDHVHDESDASVRHVERIEMTCQTRRITLVVHDKPKAPASFTIMVGPKNVEHQSLLESPLAPGSSKIHATLPIPDELF